MGQLSASRPSQTVLLSLALSVATLIGCGIGCGLGGDQDDLPPAVGAFAGLSAQEVAAAERDFRGPAPLRTAIVRSRFRRFNLAPLHAHLTQRPDDAVTLAPFGDVRLRLNTIRYEKIAADGYIWEASVESTMYSQVSLTFNEHSMFGTIQVGDRIYEFLPVKTGVVLVIQYNQAIFPVEATPRTAPPVSAVPQPQPADPAPPDREYDESLRVLLVLPKPYTYLCGQAPELLPVDFRRLVAAAFRTNLNAVFNAVAPTGVSADISIHCVDYEPNEGNLNADLDWVRTSTEVADARRTFDADLVSLLVPDGSFCGRGYLNYPLRPAHEDTAFSVVVGRCALGNHSFAHELGHNMGMRHDRSSDAVAGSADCNYGYFFGYELRFPFFEIRREARSVMAYPEPCDSCERQGVYSNPTSLRFGFARIGPMGVSCDAPGSDGSYTRADNRQQLIDAAPIVRRFR